MFTWLIELRLKANHFHTEVIEVKAPLLFDRWCPDSQLLYLNRTSVWEVTTAIREEREGYLPEA